MPYPKPTETKPSYIHRAVPVFLEEGYPLKQAVAMAHNYWKRYRKDSQIRPKGAK